jgi:hypothetical protein
MHNYFSHAQVIQASTHLLEEIGPFGGIPQLGSEAGCKVSILKRMSP